MFLKTEECCRCGKHIECTLLYPLEIVHHTTDYLGKYSCSDCLTKEEKKLLKLFFGKQPDTTLEDITKQVTSKSMSKLFRATDINNGHPFEFNIEVQSVYDEEVIKQYVMWQINHIQLFPSSYLSLNLDILVKDIDRLLSAKFHNVIFVVSAQFDLSVNRISIKIEQV